MRWILIYLLLFLLGMMSALGQTLIYGHIKTDNQKAIAFANVYLKDVFDGATSNEAGVFEFSTEHQGPVEIVVSFTGYQSVSQRINIQGDSLQLNFKLMEDAQALDPVTISAGSFEASDEKKMTILKPLDIVTVAGAQADIYQALKTLPGVAQAGDETGLLVRGGEAYETRTIVNGTILPQPFFGEAPDIPSRGRFNPFIFKETSFSTGGYSAEFGQALSSVIILNTQDIPDDESTGLSLNAASINANHSELFGENTALLIGAGYTNLIPLFGVIPQNVEWVKPPEGYGGNLAFRHRSKNAGMFKTYVQYQKGRQGMRFPDLNQADHLTDFKIKNHNIYVNSNYQGLIFKDWLLFAALSFSRDHQDISLDDLRLGEKENWTQARLKLGKEIGDKVYLNFGGEWHLIDADFSKNEYSSPVDENFGSFFTEAEISFSPKLAARIGLRSEYSGLLNQFNLAPRSSLAYKTGKNSQISLAYGIFYQRPVNDILWQFQDLNFERADHYILNYQWIKEGYTFRTEAYFKKYKQLVRNGQTELFNNTGFGQAAGIDVFWRDQKTIKNVDYWVSYSFIKSQRLYQDFLAEAQPTFISNHVLNTVLRYRIPKYNLRLGATYTYASGRPFLNPNNPEFLSDRTPDYHNLSVNVSYTTTLFGKFTVLYLTVGNPFGFEQIFGYRYSEDGQIRSPILPGAKRTAFIGLFISF